MRLYTKWFKDILELQDYVNNVLGAPPTKYTILPSTDNGGVYLVWEAT